MYPHVCIFVIYTLYLPFPAFPPSSSPCLWLWLPHTGCLYICMYICLCKLLLGSLAQELLLALHMKNILVQTTCVLAFSLLPLSLQMKLPST